MRPRGTAAALAAALWAAGCVPPDAAEHAYPAAEPAAPPDPHGTETPPPPFSEGVFPCSDCHMPEIPVNRKRREMKLAHQEIQLDHAEEGRWCLDCHDAEDRDQLHLAGGEPVPFEESYRLCGQCHGPKYRDWRAGVHGRRTGSWRDEDEQQYLLCVHCHDAHSPAIDPFEPMPPPEPPRRTR